MGCFRYVFNGYYYDPKRRIWLWKFGNSYLLWNMWAYMSSKQLCYIQHCVLMSCVFGIYFHTCRNLFFFFSLHSVKKRKHRLPFRYASLWRRGRKFWSSYFFVFKIVEGKLPLEVECIIYRTCAFIGWCKKGWELGSQLLKDFGVLLVYFFVFVWRFCLRCIWPLVARSQLQTTKKKSIFCNRHTNLQVVIVYFRSILLPSHIRVVPFTMGFFFL